MEQLSASQLAEWEAFYKLEPAEDWKADIRFAQGVSTLANLLIRAHFKKGSKLLAPEDFIVDWGEGKLVGQEEEQKKQSAEDMKRFLLQFAEKQNKEVKKKKAIRERKNKN